MHWVVVCNFDGAVALENATDKLLEHYALPEWKKIRQMHEQGMIGSKICLKHEVEMVNATITQINELADTIRIDPSFAAFANFCRKSEIPLIIVSDGIDYIVKQILARYQLKHLPVLASELHFAENGNFTLRFPFADDNSRALSLGLAEKIQSLKGNGRCLYIGDGRSNHNAVATIADAVLAKGELRSYCRRKNIAYSPFDTFTEASLLFYQMMNVRPVPVANEPAQQREAAYAA